MWAIRAAGLAAACVLSGPDLAAQLEARLHVGAVYSSPLVRDSILRPVEVQPGMAPVAALGLGWPVSPKLVADGELAVSRSNLTAEDGGVDRDLTTVTTISFTGGLAIPIRLRATARVAVGGMWYLPSEHVGLFAEGDVATILGAASVGYRWPVSERVELGAEVRYDLHAFTTPELEDRGFTGSRAVHRIGVGLSVRHRWPR